MILFMCHRCFSPLASTRHVTQSHHKWSYAMNSSLPAQPALNPRKAMSSAPLLRLNPSVQQWLLLILYFHSSPLCFVTLSCLNCFLSAMKKQPKKASQDRKGLFWLSVSEGFSTSWWGGHSSRLGRRDTRNRGVAGHSASGPRKQIMAIVQFHFSIYTIQAPSRGRVPLTGARSPCHN